MKITKQEVRTTYSIEFDLSDFTKIFINAKEDVTRINAFASFNLEDDSMENIKKCFNKFDSMFRKGSSEDLQYIVRKLGFDGIEHYGMMKTLMNGKQVYRLTVYNYGEMYL